VVDSRRETWREGCWGYLGSWFGWHSDGCVEYGIWLVCYIIVFIEEMSAGGAQFLCCLLGLQTKEVQVSYSEELSPHCRVGISGVYNTVLRVYHIDCCPLGDKQHSIYLQLSVHVS
jgi:hypothetical protein